ncbi:MAG: hypothetical protein COA59_03940 [Colwellia sp.]|nr:MAG: hypothetical protein COA59_03940 [Colwellia sp.]
MDTHLFTLVHEHFKAVEEKDLDAILKFYHDDINFIDPHYPKVHMKGKKDVFKGLTWSFKMIKKFSFNPINYFENKEGTSASVEYDSIIELYNGKSFQFPQVFIIETINNKISRLQAYEPYGPHGGHKIFLTITRLIHKIMSY